MSGGATSVFVMLVLVLLAWVSQAAAQMVDPTQDDDPGPPARSASIGVWRVEDESVLTLEFRSSRLRHRALGFDFGVAVPPEGFQRGVLVLGTDVGGVVAHTLGPAVLAFRAGLFIVPVLGGGLAVEGGMYIGLTNFILAESGRGVRLDLAAHFLDSTDSTLFSVSLGFSGQ